MIPTKLYLGTSGFSYPAWKGSFYPANLKSSAMLGYYAARFGAVEINASFYRLPTEAMLAGWLPQVGPGFEFVLKAPQRITHFQRLLGSEETLQRFLAVAATLGEHRGPLLFQLPHNMKKDRGRLAAFLELLPPGTKVSVEFRHRSWFDAEILDLLRGAGAALCWEDAEEIVSPFEATAGWGYVRLRRAEYDRGAIAAWVERIASQGWSDAHLFFKHEDEGKGPAFASAFQTAWAQRFGNADAGQAKGG